MYGNNFVKDSFKSKIEPLNCIQSIKIQTYARLGLIVNRLADENYVSSGLDIRVQPHNQYSLRYLYLHCLSVRLFVPPYLDNR